MTNFDKPGNPPTGPQKDKLLDSLFQHASPRPRAPQADEAAIRAAVHADWQQLTRQRKKNRYLLMSGLAASIVLSVILATGVLRVGSPAAEPQQFARLDVQSGEIFVYDLQNDNSTAHRLTSNTLHAGQVISTSSGARLALRWTTGESIRLDENSKLALASASQIELLAGRVYVDTQNALQMGPNFVIRTFAGPIRHSGTQYLAGIEGQTVMVAVREGKVFLDTGSADIRVHKGEMARIGPAGLKDVRAVQTFDRLWKWTNLVTPELNLDGMTADDLVRWAGRETGREVEYVDAETQKLAMETSLRGRAKLAPELALDLILQTSDVEALSENGRILVRMRTP